MTDDFWISTAQTAKRVGLRLAKAALWALGIFGIYTVLRVLDGDYDISNIVGMLLMMGAAGGFAYFVSVRINDARCNAEWAAKTVGDTLVFANRAALDARQMLDVLTEHWQRMRDEQPEIIEVVDQRTDDVPPTEPQPVVVPTEPMSKAWDTSARELTQHDNDVVRPEDKSRIHDVVFAEICAYADAYIRELNAA